MTPDATHELRAPATFARVASWLLCASLLWLGACDRAPKASSSTVTATQGSGLVIRNTTGQRPYFFDFGAVAYGENPEHVFRVENTDPAPIKIIDLLPSCGCTVPRISYRAKDGTLVEGKLKDERGVLTLPAGTTADVAIRIDTTHVERMNVDKLAQVRLRCDSPNTPFMTFELHLLVERLLRAVPARVDLGETPQSIGKSARCDVSAEQASPKARVLGLDSIRGPFETTVDETRIADIPVWVLDISAKPNQPLGPLSGTIYLKSSDREGTGEGTRFDIQVTAQIVPDVVAHPSMLLFGTIERAQGAEKQATLDALVPSERLKVLHAACAGAQAEKLSVVCTAVGPDADGRAQHFAITLRVPPGLEGELLSGQIVIETDHPRLATVHVPYSAQLR